MDKKRLNETIARVWKTNLRRAKECASRKRYLDDKKRIESFLGGDNSRMYEKYREWFDFSKKARYYDNGADRYVRLFGPSLYNKNPTPTVTARRDDAFSRAFASSQADYLEYTPDETQLRVQCRRWVDEALTAGASFLFPHVCPQSGLVTSKHVSSMDVLIDPDAESYEEAWWIARKRRLPKWKAIDLYGEEARRIKGEKSYHEEDEDLDDDECPGKTNRMVVIWEIWSKMGLGFRSPAADKEFDGDKPGRRKAKREDTEDFVYIVLADEHDVPLKKKKWPIPYYLDGTWPLTMLGYKWLPDEPWPQAPLASAVGLLETINILGSFFLDRTKNASKTVGWCAEDIHEAVKTALEGEGDLTIVPVKRSNFSPNIADSIGWSQPPDLKRDFIYAVELLDEKFERQTGLTDLLHGMTDTEPRSAESARVKDRNSRLTIDNMAEDTEYYLTVNTRKEGLVALYELEPEEVSKVQAGKVYGYKVVAMLPGEGEEGEPLRLDFEVEDHRPLLSWNFSGTAHIAGSYHESMEEAQGAADMMAQSGRFPSIGVVIEPVTAEVVWRDAQDRMTDEEIAREFHYRIEAGSSRRPNRDWEIDKGQTVWKAVADLAYGMGDFESAHAAMDNYYDSMRPAIHKSRRIYPKPPEPPPPQPGELPAGAA